MEPRFATTSVARHPDTKPPVLALTEMEFYLKRTALVVIGYLNQTPAFTAANIASP